MLRKIPKYIRKRIRRKMVLALVLLSLTSVIYAQEEDKKVLDYNDTATTIEESPPPPVETADQHEYTHDEYFNNIWDTLIVTQRNLPVAFKKKFKDDKDFWYANADIKRQTSKESAEYEREHGKAGTKKIDEQGIKEKISSYIPVGQRSWFQTLLWVIIVVAFAGVLFMYLSGSNVGLFRKKSVKVADANEEEINTEDIFAINYQKEIDKAAAQGNYRLAIRLMFLRLLKTMAEKNIINYKQDKTNFDYLLELNPTSYYQHFFRITRNYEYSWYGKFPLSEEGYKVIRSDFDQLEKQLQ